MPTGYTAPVVDGEITEVKDFATECARGIGAFMHQRDSGRAALRYPKPPVDTYYTTALNEAEAAKARWNSLSEEDKYAEWSKYVIAQTSRLHEAKADKALKRARYERMLAKVHAIDVPAEIESFKNFMVSQLEESIQFDCDGEGFVDRYYEVLDYPRWCDVKSQNVEREVRYYTDQIVKDNERYENQVAYIDLMVETYGIEVESADD